MDYLMIGWIAAGRMDGGWEDGWNVLKVHEWTILH